MDKRKEFLSNAVFVSVHLDMGVEKLCIVLVEDMKDFMQMIGCLKKFVRGSSNVHLVEVITDQVSGQEVIDTIAYSSKKFTSCKVFRLPLDEILDMYCSGGLF